MKKNTGKKNQTTKESTFVRFSIKSAFIVTFGILAVTLIPQLLFNALGVELFPLRVLLIALGSGFVFSYTLYFVDSKRGFSKSFWIVFVLIALLTGIITYFWVYNIYYI